jgi:hypothetical protein
LSVGAVSLIVFFSTIIVLLIVIIIWLFRSLRRIGPTQPASENEEEDSSASHPDPGAKPPDQNQASQEMKERSRA